MIDECFRVLRPGGRVRLATPDLAAILRVYEGPLDAAAQHYVDWVMATLRSDVRSGNPRCYVINQMFNAYGHHFIYDEETLTDLLANAGFVDVTRHEPRHSADPSLRGIESHGQFLGDIRDGMFVADGEEINRFETMVLEAIRPSGG
jgi:predicted SAM-dependent methyltransferase